LKTILKNTFLILNLKEKKKLGVFALLNVIIAVIDLTSLSIIVLIISFFTQPKYTASKFLMKLFDEQNTLLILVFFLLFFIFKSYGAYFIGKLQFNFVYNVASRISEKNLLNYLEGSYNNFTQVDSSVHVRTISHEPVEFSLYVLSGFLQMFAELFMVALTLVAIAIFNLHLFFLLAVILMPPVIIVAIFTKKLLKKARMDVKSSSETALQFLQEALAGYIESNIYEKKSFFLSRYYKNQFRFNRQLAQLQTIQGIPTRLLEVFAVAGLFFLVVTSKYTGNSGVIEIADIGAFMAAAYKIIPGIVRIQNLGGQIKIFRYTTVDLLAADRKSDPELYKPAEVLDSVIFSNVFFRHKGRQVLNNFNFEIQRGCITGISGPSGIGKSTAMNLLLGFAEEDEGQIIINNKPVDAEARKTYRSRISFVKQQPFMIHDTIKANITLDGNSCDVLKLKEAVHYSGLEQWVNLHPEGLDQVVTENGKNISGGQRQRISLARAFYKNADLLILDEPFNELDSKSEQMILNYCRQLVRSGKMIILITHNKNTLEFCDKIYYI
jgi:ABC-type multidrug transport system fused ATPase/permease subunit